MSDMLSRFLLSSNLQICLPNEAAHEQILEAEFRTIQLDCGLRSCEAGRAFIAARMDEHLVKARVKYEGQLLYHITKGTAKLV